MRIDRVKYTAHYDEFGQLKDQWIGLEAAIDDTEVPEKQLDAIKDITEKWYRKHNPHLQPQGPSTSYGNSFPGPRIVEAERSSEDKIVAELISSIYACTQLGGDDGLLTYGTLASMYTEAQSAYNVMKNKLKKTSSSYESLDDSK